MPCGVTLCLFSGGTGGWRWGAFACAGCASDSQHRAALGRGCRRWGSPADTFAVSLSSLRRVLSEDTGMMGRRNGRARGGENRESHAGGAGARACACAGDVLHSDMRPSTDHRFRCHLGSSLGFFWNLHTCGRFIPESPHRARHEFALGCGVPLRLHLQILSFLLWATLVLKMAELYKFLANGVALIAQVGSKNQAQPTRVLASVLRFLNGV